MSVRKKFDPKLFDEFDRRAKNIVTQVFPLLYPDKCYVVTENKDKYGPDLVCSVDGKLVGFIEVEVKTNWSNGLFPFPDVNIPKRKGDLSKYLNMVYVVLSKDLSVGLWIKGDKLKSASLTEVPNKYEKSGEFFYKVPVNQVHFFSTEDKNENRNG